MGCKASFKEALLLDSSRLDEHTVIDGQPAYTVPDVLAGSGTTTSGSAVSPADPLPVGFHCSRDAKFRQAEYRRSRSNYLSFTRGEW
jgi:hypothetical protein